MIPYVEANHDPLENARIRPRIRALQRGRSRMPRRQYDKRFEKSKSRELKNE